MSAVTHGWLYDPPTDRNDPAICDTCLQTLFSPFAKFPDTYFGIFNTRTGRYHSGADGKTDCGHDATGDHWLWPL